MKELIGTAVNEYFTKDGDGRMLLNLEVICMLSEPEYRISEAGIDQERVITTVRFCASKAAVDLLLKTLLECLQGEPVAKV